MSENVTERECVSVSVCVCVRVCVRVSVCVLYISHPHTRPKLSHRIEFVCDGLMAEVGWGGVCYGCGHLFCDSFSRLLSLLLVAVNATTSWNIYLF